MTDVLDDAFASLRAETSGAHDDAGATRTAILLGAARARRRRSMVVRFVLPAAAVLVATSAWAAATGRLPRRIAEIFVEERVEPSSKRMPEPPPRKPVVSLPAPSASIVVATSVSAEPSAPAPPPSAPDPEERAFRRAHEAHFATHDWNAALAGWDGYLAAYPNGRFVPEARYNRAIALVRLGRRDEARAALQPFADGAFGTYRQSEARQLLDALE